MAVAIIGILVYFLVIKKNTTNNNYLNNNLKILNKCNSNEILINYKCKRILNKLDCKSDSPYFMKLNPDTENTSCTEMTTNEKINFCSKNNLVFYDNKCMYIKTLEDCQMEDEFSIPDSRNKYTICRSLNKYERENYCEKKNMIYHEEKCMNKKSNDDCQINLYLKPDPKTNYTSCTKMSTEEIKTLC